MDLQNSTILDSVREFVTNPEAIAVNQASGLHLIVIMTFCNQYPSALPCNIAAATAAGGDRRMVVLTCVCRRATA